MQWKAAQTWILVLLLYAHLDWLDGSTLPHDQILSSVLLRLIPEGSGAGASLGAGQDRQGTKLLDALTQKQKEAAVDELQTVVSLPAVRSSLGLTQLYELEQAAAAQLLDALARPLPQAGESSAALRHLQDIRAAVEVLAGTGPDSDSGGSEAVGAPDHSFPLLRRATVARLVQLWLLHLLPVPADADWAAQAARHVEAVLLRLFELHRSGMAARPVLEFLHISKAAGTSMCQLAERSRCRALDFGMGRTCLLREFDDQPRWLNASHHWAQIAPTAQPYRGHPVAFLLYGVPRLASRLRTCAARLKLMRRRGLDFFANEFTVYNEDVLTNITHLRVAPKPPPPQRRVQLRQRQSARGRGGQGLSADEREQAEARAAQQQQQQREALRRQLDHEREVGAAAAAAAAQYSERVQRLTAQGAEAGSGEDAADKARVQGEPGGRSYSAVLRGTHLCPRFANVAVLRDPVERFRSHLLFVAHTYSNMYDRASLAAAFSPGRGDAGWWRAFAPPLADNYLLRSLVGEAAFALPAGALDAPAFLALARAVLAQYDVLLVLESGEPAVSRGCSYGLGWAASLASLNVRNTSAMLMRQAGTQAAGGRSALGDALAGAGQALRQLLPSSAVLAELEAAAVRQDVPLYRYGALLSALDDAVWQAANGSLGEPLPGLWSGQPGSAPRCGYIHMREARPR